MIGSSMAWRPNSKQWMVMAAAIVMGGLSLVAGSYASAAVVLSLAAVAVWLLDARGKRPENIVIRSVRCAECGGIGEPHWARCPKCGSSNWKTTIGD